MCDVNAGRDSIKYLGIIYTNEEVIDSLIRFIEKKQIGFLIRVIKKIEF